LGGALAIFLFVPFIFLTNINLMLFPDKWAVVRGFWDALFLPSVFTRYFHFIIATLAITSLFLVGYIGRKKYKFEEKFKTIDKKELQRQLYKIAFFANLAQFVVGTLNLLTLPTIGLKADTLITIIGGAVIAIIPTYYMWKETKAKAENVGKYFGRIVVLLSITVLFMGTGRHFYRANAVQKYQVEMQQNTDKYLAELKVAQHEAKLKAEADAKKGISGKALFESKCVMCHAANQNLVGPSVTEIVGIYKGKNQEMKNWINEPGKKRANSSQMPAFKGQFNDIEMEALVKYIMGE
jgi:cytochrome c